MDVSRYRHHTFKKAGFEIPYELVAQLGCRSVKQCTMADGYSLSRKRLQIKARDHYRSEVDLETYEQCSKGTKLRVVRKTFSCGKSFDPKKHSHAKSQMKQFQSTQIAQFLFESEIQNHARIIHENIAPVIKAEVTTDDKTKQFHIWQAYGGVDLNSYHNKNNFIGRRAIHKWMCFLLQSFKGVEHMHEKGFIHRDLKPDNIVVNEQGIARIIDLGDAHKLDNTDPLWDRRGYPYYRAPESWGCREQGKATDVYAAGMCIVKALELCGLMQPQPKARLENFCPVQWELTKAGKKVQGVIDIIPVLQKMTDDSPIARPTMSDAIDMLSEAWGPILIADETDCSSAKQSDSPDYQENNLITEPAGQYEAPNHPTQAD